MTLDDPAFAAQRLLVLALEELSILALYNCTDQIQYVLMIPPTRIPSLQIRYHVIFSFIF